MWAPRKCCCWLCVRLEREPQLDDPPSGDNDTCAVWSEFDCAEPSLSVDDVKAVTCFDVPQTHPVVAAEVAAGDDDVSSRSKRDRLHPTRVSIERLEQLACLRIPYLDTAIIAS